MTNENQNNATGQQRSITEVLNNLVDEKGLKTYVDIHIQPITYLLLGITIVASGMTIFLLSKIANKAFGK